MASTTTLLTTKLQLEIQNRHYTHSGYHWFHTFRYADDIMQLPHHPHFTLLTHIHTIYHHSIRVEDTAHYYPNSNTISHITFLDTRNDHNHHTHTNTESLFVKRFVLLSKIGIEDSLSNTHTACMTKVFASEAIRFYAACDKYSDYLQNLIRYCLQFLSRGYSKSSLLSGLRSLFKRPQHQSAKYHNTPLTWINDITAYLNPRPPNTNPTSSPAPRAPSHPRQPHPPPPFTSRNTDPASSSPHARPPL